MEEKGKALKADLYGQVPFYRSLVSGELCRFRVVYKETDLLVVAERDLSPQVWSLVREIRLPLEAYLLKRPEFLASLRPLPFDPEAPVLVKEMFLAGEVAGVGPMAAVAGAIAEEVGRALVAQGLTSQVVVENGGDVFLWLKKDAKVALFAGIESPFSQKVCLVVPSCFMPCGVCTSSGKIGHSLSFGRADAVTVVHKKASVADALATAFGNQLKEDRDFDKVIKKAKKVEDLLGVVCLLGEKLLVWGKGIRLEPLKIS
ncbi:UPF0280 family protein [Thermodesulfobacterium sp. TA1]|uniref:UPF0280 family protein n=1 Tax=Thermodesulfobacterium sp. TA1 TaxID=2234087 RepID=UPI00123206A0|nr:UPF0280 family protein [Thermodesulfobacterium sp. TA1]QER42455.1 UPF0280 family protein [Thermodesulfobacterium sp. TA1]